MVESCQTQAKIQRLNCIGRLLSFRAKCCDRIQDAPQGASFGLATVYATALKRSNLNASRSRSG